MSRDTTTGVFFVSVCLPGREVTYGNFVVSLGGPLRDSNPTWSAIWRLCCQWFGNSPDRGWLANALGSRPVTIRSYLALLNFKANHRKLVVVDEAGSLRALVTSANPHDGSSRHGNLGLSFKGPAVADVLRSERAVLTMSGAGTETLDDRISQAEKAPESVESEKGKVAVLTESAILDQALEMIRATAEGDRPVDLLNTTG